MLRRRQLVGQCARGAVPTAPFAVSFLDIGARRVAPLLVVHDRSRNSRSLSPKAAVEARRVDAHRLREVLHRGGSKPLRQKTFIAASRAAARVENRAAGPRGRGAFIPPLAHSRAPVARFGTVFIAVNTKSLDTSWQRLLKSAKRSVVIVTFYYLGKPTMNSTYTATRRRIATGVGLIFAASALAAGSCWPAHPPTPPTPRRRRRPRP